MELGNYIDECASVFLKEQGRLFDRPVAETWEEARDFLENCLAQVFETLEEVREYLEELGMDTEGMTQEEIEECLEVFRLEDGRYLVVEA